LTEYSPAKPAGTRFALDSSRVRLQGFRINSGRPFRAP